MDHTYKPTRDASSAHLCLCLCNRHRQGYHRQRFVNAYQDIQQKVLKKNTAHNFAIRDPLVRLMYTSKLLGKLA